jgi:hypothetical protein
VKNLELLNERGFETLQGVKLLREWRALRGLRMAFTFGAARDAQSGWLEDTTRQPGKAKEFLFYFAHGEPMNLDDCQTILEMFEAGGLEIVQQVV